VKLLKSRRIIDTPAFECGKGSVSFNEFLKSFL